MSSHEIFSPRLVRFLLNCALSVHKTWKYITQVSALGLLLFSLNIKPVILVICKHNGVKFSFFMQTTHKLMCNDTINIYICIYLLPLEKLERCLDDIMESMSTSKLKVSPNKTEFILFASKTQRDKLKAWFPNDILQSPLCPSKAIMIFSIWLNSDFLSKQVVIVCKSCFF